jgi:hypothetical protein
MPIFESPDSGNTVYVRESGSVDRKLWSESSENKSMHQQILEAKLWGNIRRAAKTSPALQDALERAIMIYHLTKTK